MIKRAAILFSFVAIACSSCVRHDTAVLAIAMHGQRLASAHDIKVREGGLREWVVEIYCHANPNELRSTLQLAGFVRDDSIPDRVRRAFPKAKDLIGNEIPSSAVGFRRTDLKTKNGKYCELLCADDFTWAYVNYVDSGTS